MYLILLLAFSFLGCSLDTSVMSLNKNSEARSPDSERYRDDNSSDSGSIPDGTDDGGTTDGGIADDGITDGGIDDGETTDGETADGGATDSGTVDDGTDDGGTTDGGTADDGTADDGTTDDGTTDGGTTDGGITDGGATDGGTADDGTTDDGTTDDGTTDGGTTDGGATDGGATDGGATDGGATDGGTADDGTTDDGTTDDGTTDDGTTDDGTTDDGTTDGGTTDGGTTDGGATDGGATDGGATDGGTEVEGCSAPYATNYDPSAEIDDLSCRFMFCLEEGAELSEQDQLAKQNYYYYIDKYDLINLEPDPGPCSFPGEACVEISYPEVAEQNDPYLESFRCDEIAQAINELIGTPTSVFKKLVLDKALKNCRSVKRCAETGITDITGISSDLALLNEYHATNFDKKIFYDINTLDLVESVNSVNDIFPESLCKRFALREINNSSLHQNLGSIDMVKELFSRYCVCQDCYDSLKSDNVKSIRVLNFNSFDGTNRVDFYWSSHGLVVSDHNLDGQFLLVGVSGFEEQGDIVFEWEDKVELRIFSDSSCTNDINPDLLQCDNTGSIYPDPNSYDTVLGVIKISDAQLNCSPYSADTILYSQFVAESGVKSSCRLLYLGP